MELPEQALLQQLKSSPVSGEHLEILGKKASADWGAGRFDTLTQAVIETVKHASLSPEQVRRVVEFANTDAYLRDFRKEGSPHKIVNFPGGPADPGDVLKDLNDGGGGSAFDTGMGDYSQPPSHSKHASVETGELETMFEVEKTASSLGYPEENPMGQIIELKDKLAHALDTCGSQLSQFEVMYADLADLLYGQVKQAALNGTTLGEILQAWQTVAPSTDHVKVAFRLMTPRLLREGVFHSVDGIGASIEKTGSARMVNTQHPLVTHFSEYCEVLDKLAETRAAQNEISANLDQVIVFIKQGGVFSQAHKAIVRGGEAAAPFLSKHLDVPEAVTKGVSKAVLPLAAVGVGDAAWQKLKYSPVGQTVLPHVPGTSARQQYISQKQQQAMMNNPQGMVYT